MFRFLITTTVLLLFASSVKAQSLSASKEMQLIAALDSLLSDTTVYTMTERPAAFPGGDDSLMHYLHTHMPAAGNMTRDAAPASIMYVSFIIGKDGSVGQAKLARPVSGNTDYADQVIAMIRNMPHWFPALNNGYAVRTQYLLPLRVCYN